MPFDAPLSSDRDNAVNLAFTRREAAAKFWKNDQPSQLGMDLGSLEYGPLGLLAAANIDGWHNAPEMPWPVPVRSAFTEMDYCFPAARKSLIDAAEYFGITAYEAAGVLYRDRSFHASTPQTAEEIAKQLMALPITLNDVLLEDARVIITI